MDKGGEEGSDRQEGLVPSDNEHVPTDSEVMGALPESMRHQEFFSRMSREEKQLLLLRNELYDGSWDEMETDLSHRLDRKPYIFRLMNRIEEDLARIERLRAYEDEHNVDLGVFIGFGIDDR